MELLLLQRTGTIETTFEVQGSPIKMDEQKELILFRMIQEALQNIVKHANATNLQVFVNYEAQGLILNVLDNGVGFDPNGKISLGSGLRNMHNRSRIIGAEFNIQAAMGKGTTICITLPYLNQTE